MATAILFLLWVYIMLCRNGESIKLIPTNSSLSSSLSKERFERPLGHNKYFPYANTSPLNGFTFTFTHSPQGTYTRKKIPLVKPSGLYLHFQKRPQSSPTTNINVTDALPLFRSLDGRKDGKRRVALSLGHLSPNYLLDKETHNDINKESSRTGKLSNNQIENFNLYKGNAKGESSRNRLENTFDVLVVGQFQSPNGTIPNFEISLTSDQRREIVVKIKGGEENVNSGSIQKKALERRNGANGNFLGESIIMLHTRSNTDPIHFTTSPTFPTFILNTKRRHDVSSSIPNLKLSLNNAMSTKTSFSFPSSIILVTREKLKSDDDQIVDTNPKFFKIPKPTTIQNDESLFPDRNSVRTYSSELFVVSSVRHLNFYGNSTMKRRKRSAVVPIPKRLFSLFKSVKSKRGRKIEQNLENEDNLTKPRSHNFSSSISPSLFFPNKIGEKIQARPQAKVKIRVDSSNEKLPIIYDASQSLNKGFNRFSPDSNEKGESSSVDLWNANNSNFPWPLDSKDFKNLRSEINHPYEHESKALFSYSEKSYSVQTKDNHFLLPEQPLNTSVKNEFYDNDLNITNSTTEDYYNTSSKSKEDLIREFIKDHPVELWKSFGLYDDSYLESVASHWLTFEAAEPLVHQGLAVCYFIIMVIGCGGNLLVITMFIKCRSLRTPPIYLIINLAISDFFLLAKMPIFIVNSLYYGPVLGALGCKIYGFVGGLTGTASIMTLTAISVDRYFVIVFPLNMRITTSSRALFLLSLVWLYSFTFSSLPLFGLNAYVSEGYLTSCSFDYLSDNLYDRIFVFVFFIAAWFLPLSIIIFSYINIYKTVRRAERSDFFGGPNDGSTQRESFRSKHDEKKQKTEVKIAILSSIIIIIWLLAWTPYACVALLGIFGYESFLTPFASAAPALFCKTASCIDPFVYALNHPRFQRELKNKFRFFTSGCLKGKQGPFHASKNQMCNYSTVGGTEENFASFELTNKFRYQSGGRTNKGCEFSPNKGQYVHANTNTMRESNRLIGKEKGKEGFLTSVEVTIDSRTEQDAEEKEELATNYWEKDLRKRKTELVNRNSFCNNRPIGSRQYVPKDASLENEKTEESVIVRDHRIVNRQQKNKSLHSEWDISEVNQCDERIFPVATSLSDSSDIKKISRNGNDSSFEMMQLSSDANKYKHGKPTSILVQSSMSLDCVDFDGQGKYSSPRTPDFKRKPSKNTVKWNIGEEKQEQQNPQEEERGKVMVDTEKGQGRVKLETLIM